MNKKVFWSVIVSLAIAGATAIFLLSGDPGKQAPPSKRGGTDGAGRPVPVMVAIAKAGDIDVMINALGTVTARNTATVKPRVDGQLVRVSFREGQFVKAGDLLAEIDPRPFQMQLDQMNGQLIRDQALLANAKLDQVRYRGLLAKDSIAKQQVDTQDALVRQYDGVVKADKASVDNARLQLSFARVTAPISGRVGLRLIDNGNMVRSADAGGLVVITQTQPINIIFSIPSDSLPPVLSKMKGDKRLVVEAWDRDNKNRLALGTLMTIDNQIDITTGTVKLKAEFTNADNTLFSNQFVNIRLRIDTLHGVTLVPTSAPQRGTQGNFVYVADENKTVSIRLVTLGPVSNGMVAIEKGLAPGEGVVIDGVDKLRSGAKIEASIAGEKGGEGKPAPEDGKREKRHRPPGESKNGA